MYNYIKNPEEIYQESFRIIDSEIDFSSSTDQYKKLVTRIIHACGDTSILKDLIVSKHAILSGINAINNQSDILVDSKMVQAGVIVKNLSNNKIRCFIKNKKVERIAKEKNITRSAASVDLWKKYISNSIVIIGNAPTALFRTLEFLNQSEVRPKLIIGMPLGFVGAEESKEELINNKFGIEHITIRGRRGGSAMACAAINSIALMNCDEEKN
tara:strand:- start:13965 stop:14603 length:639 start_codon:yes stop_codon:yes gene_type:complete